MSEQNLSSMTELVSLSKRRGFVFQSSEIYGGLGSCWDYGSLGVELKHNVKSSWWKAMTFRPDIEGIDAAIMMHPKVWKASGHVDGFSDPLIDCKNCKSRFREDQIDTSAPCPKCGKQDFFTEPREFNLMFKTQMGAVEEDSSVVYLRPETAQGIFVNFQNIQQTTRQRIPFGIAQIGKAFRNEITPGNFIFRTREFEQMEMQYFVKPGTQLEMMEKWKELRWNWHVANGIRPDNLKWTPHPDNKLAHYADAAIDIDYRFPMGWGELEGIHSRTNFDLTQHQEHSGKSLLYVDQIDNNQKYLPYVIETSAGCDRTILALMCDAYRLENQGTEQERVVMKFHPQIAPVKIAVMPLMKKPPLQEIANKLMEDLSHHYKVDYDVTGSIGKRYRRQDEIGTPFCLTVDYDTLENNKITIRDRDSMKQESVEISQIDSYLKDRLKF